MRIGMYFNWGVKKADDGFYVPAVHEKYLRVFGKKSQGPLVLLSKLDRTPIASTDIFVSARDVDLIPLPPFKNYLSSILYVPQIVLGLFRFARKSEYCYIRTFEPFSWILLLFKNSSALTYHFVANPFEAIWGNTKSSWLKKILRSAVFLPEFYLICLAAALSNATCNGPSVLPRVPFFLRSRMRLLIESTLEESDYHERNFKAGEEHTLKILSVGYLRYAKGVGDLLQAVALFKKSCRGKLAVSIVGDGEDQAHLTRQVEELGLGSEVTFQGHLSGRALARQYEDNDLFIMPSHAETGPRVILEAMARGMFCISTDVGYVRQVLTGENGLQGILVAKGSPQEISEALMWYEKNLPEARKKAEQAYLLSKAYSIQSFVDSIFQK